MRRLLLCLPVLAGLLFIFLSNAKTANSYELMPADYRPYNADEVISCGPSITADIFPDAERKMVPLPGWGRHTWKIDAANDSAQFYFNQGLNLFYSFHMQESKASFLEAQRHDPACAMAYWGQTMAEGPYINTPTYNFSDPALVNILEKAETLAKNELEREIICAQQLRFTTASRAERKDLSIAYKNALQALYEKHPSNTELAVLYADALMLITPRDWYTVKGEEKEGTTDIVNLLANILQTNPNHPAALHYYIHMVEPSTRPERAKDEADRLRPLLPSVAHMVHMPSHIYIRTGDYSKGITSNIDAIKGYDAYRKVMKGWQGARYTYFYHNADMQGANAALMGNYKEAKKAYAQNLDQFYTADYTYFDNPSMLNTAQFVTAQPFLLDVRFGNWQNILNNKGLLTTKPYHSFLWHFGKGMAHAKTGKIEEAQKSLTLIKELMKDPTLNLGRPNRSRAIDAANVALHILQGTINAEQKLWDDAIQQFEAAVEAEDKLLYSEPEDWRLPARHFLGQAYLQKGEPAKAQEVFEKDLVDHPQNYWALNGLHLALLQQNKAEAARHLKQKHKAALSSASLSKPLKGAVY